MKNISLALFAGVLALSSIPVSAQIFVSNEDGTTISVINPNIGIVKTIDGLNGPDGIAITPDFTRAYVTNTDGATVSVINLTTLMIVATIPVGNDPNRIAITPNGLKAYVTNSNDGTISVINTTTNMVSTTIVLPITPPDLTTPTPQDVAITPDGTRAYVANEDGVNMYVINTATDTPTALNVGIQTGALGITPDGTKVYAGGHLTTSTNVGEVQVINLPANTLGALIPLPASPHGVGISPNSKRAYTTNEDDGTVSIIDTATDTVVGKITGFSEPERVKVSPDGGFLYVTDTGDPVHDGDRPTIYGANSLDVFSTADNSFIAAFNGQTFGIRGAGAGPEDPEGIAFGPVVPPPGNAYQLRYAANLTTADSVIDITNTGASATAVLKNQNPAQNNIDGSICVNIYAFAADEQEVACCSCLITPNALWSASVKTALLNSTLTPAFPNEIVIKLISSVPNAGAGTQPCNPATVDTTGGFGAGRLAPGAQAWGTTAHGFPTAAGPNFQLTETPFHPGTLTLPELQRSVVECQFIQVLGSGQFGMCKGCTNAGLGANAQ
jgi:YVTN family beta-propeller protein